MLEGIRFSSVGLKHVYRYIDPRLKSYRMIIRGSLFGGEIVPGDECYIYEPYLIPVPNVSLCSRSLKDAVTSEAFWRLLILGVCCSRAQLSALLLIGLPSRSGIHSLRFCSQNVVGHTWSVSGLPPNRDCSPNTRMRLGYYSYSVGLRVLILVFGWATGTGER